MSSYKELLNMVRNQERPAMAEATARGEKEVSTSYIQDKIESEERTPKQSPIQHDWIKDTISSPSIKETYGTPKTADEMVSTTKAMARDQKNSAKARAAAAEKEHQDYLKTPEFGKGLTEREKKYQQDLLISALSGGGYNAKMEDDPEELRLRAAAEQARAEADAEENERVMASDLEAITGLSNEDRRALEQYAVGREVDHYDSLNMAQNGLQIGRAEQMAAGLIQKYGQEQVDNWANSIIRAQNKKMSEKVAQKGQEQANSGVLGAVGASAASVPTSALGGVGGLISYFRELGRNDKRYTTLDPNSVGNLGNVYSSAVRGQVAQNIEEDNGLVGKAGSVLYQGVMSAADTIARGYLGGGALGGAALAATGSFSQTMAAASRQGASPTQAAILATVTAGIEAASEKLPLDKLIRMAKGGNIVSILKNIGRQAGVEMAEEEASLLGSLLAEAAVLQEKAGYQRTITSLILQGVSPEAAREQAAKDIFNEAVNTAVVSAVSGGLSAGGASLIGAKNQQTQQETSQQPEMGVISQETQAQEQPQKTVQEAQTEETVQTLPPTAEPTAQHGSAPAAESMAASGTNAISKPIESYPVEKQNTIRSYIQSVDDSLKSFVQRVKGGDKTFRRQKISDVSARAAQDVGKILGVDANGYTHNINTGGVQHIINRHGANGEHDNSMTLDDDIARVGWVLDNYDSVELLTENGRQVYSKEFKDSDNNPAPQIRFIKKIDGSYYVVEAACENKYKKMWVQSVYLQKNNGDVTQVSAEDLSAHHETNARSALASPSPINSISERQADVNGKSVGMQSTPQEDTKIQSTEGGYAPGIKGTGAAEAEFSEKPAYNATLSEDNAQADRRNDVRPMELPARDINGRRISAVTGNVYAAAVTPDELASLMEELTARGEFSYVTISNNAATQAAQDNISHYGWEDSYRQWHDDVHRGRAGAEMSARGALFLNHAARAGDRQQWLNILSDFQRLGTNTAQGLQAFRILRNLAPSDQLYMMRRSVAQMVEDMHLNVPIEIDQQLADQYQNAETNEEADTILDEIISDVAAQIPSTAADRWTALRYVNMLGNMRTQARNISGNIGAKVTYLAKDQIGAVLEKVVRVFNPNFQRTKSAWVSNDLKALGRADFDEVRDIVLENGRFDDARRFDSTYFVREVNDRRRIFSNRLIESYRRLTNWAMNNDYFGDAGFARSAYARAFGGYLKANGFIGDTLEGIDQTLLDNARLYAIQQAQESTFRDHNAVSDWVGRIGRRQDTPRAVRALSEGAMPFRSTPANVLVRAEEFSPLGIFNTAVTAAQAANPNSDVTGTDVVESMAKTLTGTGLFILGAYLGKMGILAGGPDPDEEKAEFDQMNGYQNYALQLPGNKNITIDFLSPLAVPMFLGAEWEKIISDGGYDLADFETVFTSLADPLIQMSMLQGLNDTLDNIKYSENNLGQLFLNSTISYLTQGLTNTLMGQLERSGEENRMTTYIEKDSSVPQWLQRQLGKISQKIPGWDYQQMEYRNAWGSTEKNEGALLYNLLSPGYISTEQSDKVSQELYRLRETTGESVFPQTAKKTISYTDTSGVVHTDYNLSAEEYDELQKVQGQTAAKLIASMVSNADYQDLTDTQRTKAIKDVYSYAQEKAKAAALPNYRGGGSEWMSEVAKDPVNGIIRRVVSSTINSEVNNIGSGEKTTLDTKILEQMYTAYKGMSQEAKAEILESANDTATMYIEARNNGVSHASFVKVANAIATAKGTGDVDEATGAANVREIDRRYAISQAGLDEKTTDILMKAYMEDYDPNNEGSEKTELKYDYIRQVLGLSAEAYTETYRAHLDNPKKADKIAAIMELGYSKNTATTLYNIYASNTRGKKAYMEYYEENN